MSSWSVCPLSGRKKAVKPVKPAKKGAVPTRDRASSVDKLVARARVDEDAPSALICIDFSSLVAQSNRPPALALP